MKIEVSITTQAGGQSITKRASFDGPETILNGQMATVEEMRIGPVEKIICELIAGLSRANNCITR